MVEIFEDSIPTKNMLETTLEYMYFGHDMSLVNLEYRNDNGKRQEFSGIEKAKDITEKGGKVIVYGFMKMPFLYTRQDFRELFAYNYDKVRYLRLPFQIHEVLGAFDVPQYENPALVYVTRSTEKERMASQLIHDMGYRREENLRKARDFFKLEGTDEEAEKQLRLIRDSAGGKKSLNGIYLPGVFCDVEGTFLKDGKVDEALHDELRKYAKEKSVSLWTGGNVNELSRAVGDVRFPVLDKNDYTGAEVELAIDDMPQDKFGKEYGIGAKKFIRV